MRSPANYMQTDGVQGALARDTTPVENQKRKENLSPLPRRNSHSRQSGPVVVDGFGGVVGRVQLGPRRI